MVTRYRPVPADSYVSSPFGPRWGTEHRGVDFGREGGSANMPVYAAQSGTVVYSGAASGFGGPDPAGWLVVDHPTDAGGGATVYGHIIREVARGDRVTAGQRIGRVNPNQSTNGNVAPHLHFEYHPYAWLQGSQRDPLAWLGDAPSPDEVHVPDGDDILAPGVIAGVDVSEWQDGMSLKRAADEGMSFAVVRTSDGTYRDRTYLSHLLDAEGAGLVTAAYMYLRNPAEGSTVEQQVAASLGVMGDHRRPVWIDCETPAGLHVSHIREAKARFESAGVRVIGVYSYVPYWERQVAPGEPDTHEFGALWVAAYGNNPKGSPRALYARSALRQWDYPLGNQKPAVWQYGSNAVVAGWQAGVDINAYRGTRDELRALFYGVTDAPAVEKVEVDAPVTPAPRPQPLNPPVGFDVNAVLADLVEDAPAGDDEPVEDDEPDEPVEDDPRGPIVGDMTFEVPPAPATSPAGPLVEHVRRTLVDVIVEFIVSLFLGRRR